MERLGRVFDRLYIWLVLIVCLLFWVQVSRAQGINTIQLQTANPQPVTSISPVVSGTAGTTTIYYTIVANYPIGQIASQEIPFNSAPNTLSVSNFVQVFFNTVGNPLGANVTYDLLAASTPGQPHTCASCLVSSGNASSPINDQGARSAYTYNQAPAASALIRLNNIAFQTARLEASVNGSPFGAFPPSVYTVSSSSNTGSAQIPAAQLINGIFNHTPTSAATDTTDSAANIIAAFPGGCQVGGTFAFVITNTGALNPVANLIPITLVGGAGVTITGNAVITRVGQFFGTVTNCTTPAVTISALDPATKHLVAWLTPFAVPAGQCAEQQFNVPGVLFGDAVFVSRSQYQPGLDIGASRVPANGILAINFCNQSPFSIALPASELYNIVAIN